jgi:hypothetical protein
MNYLKELPPGYTIAHFQKHMFFEQSSFSIFPLMDLQFWQLLEMKNFVKKTPFVQFLDYGFNAEKKAGKITLNVSKLKTWTRSELLELENIIGKRMTNLLCLAGKAYCV